MTQSTVAKYVVVSTMLVRTYHGKHRGRKYHGRKYHGRNYHSSTIIASSTAISTNTGSTTTIITNKPSTDITIVASTRWVLALRYSHTSKKGKSVSEICASGAPKSVLDFATQQPTHAKVRLKWLFSDHYATDFAANRGKNSLINTTRPGVRTRTCIFFVLLLLDSFLVGSLLVHRIYDYCSKVRSQNSQWSIHNEIFTIKYSQWNIHNEMYPTKKSQRKIHIEKLALKHSHWKMMNDRQPTRNVQLVFNYFLINYEVRSLNEEKEKSGCKISAK